MNNYVAGLSFYSSMIIISASSTIIFILIKFLKYFLIKNDGQKRVYSDLMTPIQVMLLAYTFIPMYLYFVSGKMSDEQLQGTRSMLFFALPFMTSTIFLMYLWPLYYKTINIEEQSLSSDPDKDGLLIGHISDAHLPERFTLEKALSKQDVSAKLLEAMRGLSTTCDYIFFTGDVTDTGSVKEWELFRRLCRKAKISNEKMFIVPGNHDTTMELSDFSIIRNYTKAYDDRNRNFIKYVLLDCPKSWLFLYKDSMTPIYKLFDYDVRTYIQMYSIFPPEVTLLPAKPTSNHYLHVPDKLLDFIESINSKRKLIWPNKTDNLMTHLMGILFPIVFRFDSKYIIIGLNSCSRGSLGVVDCAFGLLGTDQLDKLKKILEFAEDRKVIILIHHHVGLPPRIKKLKGFEAKFLQLTDAAKLLKVMSTHTPLIFHGHKHVAYSASHNGTQIFSAASICYGDDAGFENPISIYSISGKSNINRIKTPRIDTAEVANTYNEVSNAYFAYRYKYLNTYLNMYDSSVFGPYYENQKINDVVYPETGRYYNQSYFNKLITVVNSKAYR